jgi:hypothetical protein
MTDKSARIIKQKNVFLVYLFMVITFGIYSLVWYVKSKRDMNALGAQIPTSWLMVIPVVGIFWFYKYCEGYGDHVKKNGSGLTLFAITFLLGGLVTPFIVQSELNKHANEGTTHQTAEPTAAAAA